MDWKTPSWLYRGKNYYAMYVQFCKWNVIECYEEMIENVHKKSLKYRSNSKVIQSNT